MFYDLVGQCAAMQQVFDLVRRYGATSRPVLIVGETGTGKELVARAIHAESPRASHRFVPLNCAAVPESLLDSLLFGHEKGAFTGAHQSQAGWFEAARGGTLFLDEIAEPSHSAPAAAMPPNSQPR